MCHNRSGSELRDMHTNLITPPTMAETMLVVPVSGSRAKEEVT
jgi:hypothetical protein